ncbi:hypothetical protein PIROE2DRAFT_12007, partial [Piromyces sp. E2]
KHYLKLEVFLKIHQKIPNSFKRSVIVLGIGIVAYYASLLGSNKARTNGTQQLVNKGLYWISGSKNKNSFVSLYTLSKELNIPPLSAKCALAQNRCFEKWKESKCIISTLVNNIPKHRKYFWCKESRLLNRKLAELKSKEKIKEFYWNRDLLKKSIKADNYIENKFEETRGYYKLNLEFPQYTKGFHGLLKASDSCNGNSENSGNISGNNSNEIGLNNSSNEISNNSDSVNENLSVNNLSVNNLNVNRSSINRSKRKCSKVFNFLLDISFLVKTAAFFNKVMPIVSGQRWSVINRYSTKVTESANADNTVRQASSANDHLKRSKQKNIIKEKQTNNIIYNSIK